MNIATKPFGIIKTRRPEFLIFVLTNTLFAQVGLLGALILVPAFGQGNFLPLLAAQLRGANLFVFAISLLVAACVPFLLEYVREDEIHFRELKLVVASLSLTLIVVQALGTGMILSRELAIGGRGGEKVQFVSLFAEHWLQIVLYGLSILLSIYVFCVTQLHHDLPNYAGLDDQTRDQLAEETAFVALVGWQG